MFLDQPRASIVDNTVDLGKDVSVARRGHGVYFWQVARTVVHGNTIRNAADGIHLEFSDDNGIGSNIVTDSRYALHLHVFQTGTGSWRTRSEIIWQGPS